MGNFLIHLPFTINELNLDPSIDCSLLHLLRLDAMADRVDLDKFSLAAECWVGVKEPKEVGGSLNLFLRFLLPIVAMGLERPVASGSTSPARSPFIWLG